MFRKLAESFTATHVTAIFIAAILVPSAAYAVTYSNVAITDATSGTTAMVDGSRRLHTYDSLAALTNNPKNLVNIVYHGGNSGSTVIYTVPAGKTLIIKEFTWDFYYNAPGTDIFVYLYDSADKNIMGFDSDRAHAVEHATFDAGLVAHAGTLTADWGTTTGGTYHNLYIQGYLVPAATAPMAGTPEAMAQLVSKGSTVKRRR
jgi:hypothetical protein